MACGVGVQNHLPCGPTSCQSRDARAFADGLAFMRCFVSCVVYSEVNPTQSPSQTK